MLGQLARVIPKGPPPHRHLIARPQERPRRRRRSGRAPTPAPARTDGADRRARADGRPAAGVRERNAGVRKPDAGVREPDAGPRADRRRTDRRPGPHAEAQATDPAAAEQARQGHVDGARADHRVLAGARVVVRGRAGAGPPAFPAGTGSTGCTRRAACRWRATGSASTAACTRSTRSATGGWVTNNGTPTSAGNGFSAGPLLARRRLLAGPRWAVTFPLLAGGWSAGAADVRAAPRRDVRRRRDQPLHFWRSIAVDPDVIPLGSRVYVPAYRHDGYGGWFVAQDTGGAINGAHVDVYRSPPRSPSVGGQELTGQRVFVIQPRG